MTHTPDIVRPDLRLVEALREIGTATIASELRNFGIRNASITGPRSFTIGKVSAGPALTLQFMPMREDQFGAAEYDDPEKQLHRHVLYHARKGDMVVVDARGDMDSGIFGEMMLTYFAGLGGEGVVIDGCIRDSAKARDSALACGCAASRPISTRRRTSFLSPSTCLSPAPTPSSCPATSSWRTMMARWWFLWPWPRR